MTFPSASVMREIKRKYFSLLWGLSAFFVPR